MIELRLLFASFVTRKAGVTLIPQREGEQGSARGDGDELFAVERVTHRTVIDPAVHRSFPEQSSASSSSANLYN